jgi:hypothetical protein
MPDDLIPRDVLEFLLAYIDSIAELEALLLLRSDPDRTWTPAAMSARLYSEEAHSAQILNHLLANGLCTAAGGHFRYGPSDVAKHDTAERLAHAYAHYLIPVTNVIHGKPPSIQKFADAFRLRRGK